MLSPIGTNFLSSLDHSDSNTYPFQHWLLNRVLPECTCAAVDALPVSVPAIADTLGRRETHNSSRLFFGATQLAAYTVCREVASALQNNAVVRQIEALCDVALGGSFLRIEYCLDTDGFWLEPHTDIGAKLFTMLIYLSDDPGSEGWGTDLLDGPDTLVTTMPYQRNFGCIFIPSERQLAWLSSPPDRRRATLADRELRQAGVAFPARAGVSRQGGAERRWRRLAGQSRFASRRGGVIVEQDPVRRAVQVVVLARPQRPQEKPQAAGSNRQADHQQIQMIVIASHSCADAGCWPSPAATNSTSPPPPATASPSRQPPAAP